MKEYLLRSLLFVPAYNEKFIDNALNCNADAIIIDLEDAVPAVFKADARKILGQYIVKGAFKNKTVFIRFNSFDSGELMKDIETLLSDDIDGVVLTKINSAQDIAYYDDLFNKVESEKGYAKGHFKFLPLIETAEAVINAFSIAKASERVIALCFGAEDYLNDIMGIHGNPPVALNYPRAVIATAARAAGVYPIDTPYLVLKNPEGFMEEEKLSFEMGYAGALLIHPSQIELANVCFMPSETEIERSRNILEAVEKSKKAGSGVTMLNGKMVEPPMQKKAEKTLQFVNLVKRNEKH